MGRRSLTYDEYEFYEEFGDRFYRLRKKMGMTRNEIGKELGVTEQRIYQIEKGVCKAPMTLFMLSEFSKKFGLNPNVLLFGKAWKQGNME